MSAIAVQSFIGDIGKKPVTKFTNFDFNSLIQINGFPFGTNDKGLFLLNSGNTDDGKSFERIFTLVTSDFNIQHYKRFRYIYLGIDTDIICTLFLSVDKKEEVKYYCKINKTGLQRIRIPISRKQQGRYWKLKITATDWFRIDHIQGLITIRSSGIGGR